jgi:hypothetical protein
VFPSEGAWSYEVWDDFSRTHTFKAVEIAAPGGGGFPLFETLLALGLAAALAAATILLLRRRPQPRPQPVQLKEVA